MYTDRNKQTDFKYEKFILYLYMVAAYADYQIQEEEIDLIRDKVSSRDLINVEVFDRTFNEVLLLFKSHNDFESMQYIEKQCKELEVSNEAKLKIYHDFQDIIMADGKEENIEKMNMYRFRKMLGIEAAA